MSRFKLQHCPPNPTLEYACHIEVPEGTTEIVSEGGGSTIDVGKWVAKEHGLKHLAIPTTAGTGSEVTKYCVLTVSGKKTTFVDDAYIPNGYILDPEKVVGLPPLHTLASGLDALSQALEAYWSKNATQESLHYSAAALDIIPRALLRSLEEPTDLVARMDMLIAANLAGRAINITKTNVCHAISYPLTEKYEIPHGIACGLTLGYFAKKAVGLDLTSYLDALKIPSYNLNIDDIADIAIKSPKLKDFPTEITREDIITALNERSQRDLLSDDSKHSDPRAHKMPRASKK